MKTESELLLPSSVLRPVRPENIPAELTARAQWVVWREELLPGRDKPTKPPRDPRTGVLADVVYDPTTWATFAEAFAAYEKGDERGKYDGIGFVVTAAADDPFVGVDLDHCRDAETGELLPWAERIVRKLDSYTEVSPSGEGLRIWVRGALPLPEPGGRNKRNVYGPGDGVEMYDAKHYLTVTGEWLRESRASIEDRNAEIREVYAEVFGGGRPERLGPSVVEPELPELLMPHLGPETDDALIAEARRARNGNGEKFTALFDRGDISGYASQSEADLALCGMLAFWFQRDAVRMDQFFRRSALYRASGCAAKWNEQHFADGRTYGEATIARAIDGCDRVYTRLMPPTPLTPLTQLTPLTLTPTMQEVLMTQTTAPPAREIANFKILTEITGGGLQGLWVIGGAPKSGKSTLAANIVANVAGPELPVLYLDLENDTGPVTRVIGERIASAYGDDAVALRYLRGYRNLDKLQAEMVHVEPRPLIVIDHLQLLARGDNAKTATDAVVHRLIDWVREGYTVLALSQVNRASYGRRPTMADFKESGGIEAAAGAALFVWQRRQGEPSRVTVVALRYAERPSQELEIARDGWRLIEARALPLGTAAKARLAATVEPTPTLTQVQRAISNLGSPARTEDVLRELGVRKKQRRTGERRLKRAASNGEIVKLGKGRWALPDAGDATTATDATDPSDATDHATTCRIDVASDVASSDALIPA